MSATILQAAVPNRFTGVTDLIHTMRNGAGAEDLRTLLQNHSVRLYHGSSTDPSSYDNRNWSAMGSGLYLTSRDRAVDYAVWRANESKSSFSPVLSMYTIRAPEINFYICHRERFSSNQLCNEWRTFLNGKINNPPLNERGTRLYPDPVVNWNNGVKILLENIIPGCDIGALVLNSWGEKLFPEFMRSQGFGGIAAFEGHDGTGQRGPTMVIFDRSDSRITLEGTHTFGAPLGTGKPIKTAVDFGKIILPTVDHQTLNEGSFTPLELPQDGTFLPMQLKPQLK
jgi:hypothetical protein